MAALQSVKIVAAAAATTSARSSGSHVRHFLRPRPLRRGRGRGRGRGAPTTDTNDNAADLLLPTASDVSTASALLRSSRAFTTRTRQSRRIRIVPAIHSSVSSKSWAPLSPYPCSSARRQQRHVCTTTSFPAILNRRTLVSFAGEESSAVLPRSSEAAAESPPGSLDNDDDGLAGGTSSSSAPSSVAESRPPPPLLSFSRNTGVDPVILSSPKQVWMSKTRRALERHRRQQQQQGESEQKIGSSDPTAGAASHRTEHGTGGGATAPAGGGGAWTVFDADDDDHVGGLRGRLEWELEPCLHYWCHQRPATLESVQYAFQILDVMLEHHHCHHVRRRVSNARNDNADDDPNSCDAKATAWLNMALDHWRVGIVEGDIAGTGKGGVDGSGVPVSVEDVWQRLRHGDDDHHGPGGLWRDAANTKTYGLLLSAVASSSAAAAASGDRSMPRLANAILDHCLDAARHGNPNVDATSTPVLWNTAMLAWAKAPMDRRQQEQHQHQQQPQQDDAASGSVQEVMSLLSRMKELGVEPTQVTYATILQTLSSAAAFAAASEAAAASPVKVRRRRPRQAQADVPANPNLQLARDQYVDLVQKVLDEADRNLDLEPIDVCYLHALQTLVNCRRLDDAYDLLHSRVAKYRDSSGLDDRIEDCDRPLIAPVAALKPSRQMFGVVMSGFAKQGNVDKVVSLFQDLLSLYSATEDDRRACLTTINLVLHALAEARTIERAQQAQELLERVVESEIGKDGSYGVDTASYNTVLHAWAMCTPEDPRRCVERAEALLQVISNPNTISYTNVIKAWARSDIRSPPAAERCLSFLNAMWEHHNANSLLEQTQSVPVTNTHRPEGGVSSVKPNAITYTTVLYAWSRSYSPRAPFEAERLFTDMMNRYRNGEEDLQPTEGSYVALMIAWNRSDNRKRAASRVQFYFDQWVEHCQAQSLPVSSNVYHLVMKSKIRAGDGVGAEQLLEDIVDTYRVRTRDDGGENGSRLFSRPMYETFRIAASGAVNAHDALERLERIISMMKELEETHGWHDLKPKASILVLLLQALAESRVFLAAKKATRILRDMEASQDPDARPNPQCYAEVLSAWSRSRIPEAADRTEALFQDMLTKYRAGDDSCRPNSKVYGTVLSSYAYSVHPDAPLKALSLLNELDDMHQRYGDKFERPNSFHYSAVINAFAERGDVDNARTLLERMQRRSDQDGVGPTAGCYNGLIKAIVNSRAADAGEQAEEVLRNTLPRSGLGSPDVTTYTICISAWQHSDRPEAADRAEMLLRECVQLASESDTRADLQPNAKTFLAYVRVVIASGVEDKADRVKGVVSWMKQLRVRPSYDLRLAINEVVGLEAKPDASSVKVLDETGSD